MKTPLFFLAVLFGINATAQSTANTSANAKTVCVNQYLNSLSGLSSNKVLSGQWMNFRGLPETPASEYDTVITSLFNQTQKYVGILGTEYMREFTGPPFLKAIKDLKPVNQPLINYSKQNGIITVMTTFKNPWTKGNQNDLTNSTNLLDVTTTGTTANINFLKELDSVALGFQQLQDSGVTVLYRPFHEMNGSWFWWGSKSSTLPVASDFTTLWQYVFDYFTTTKKLNNILWFYTPCMRASSVQNPSYKSELFYYPGSKYVDVIGLDVYEDTLSFPNYAAVVATGKPIGIAEFGPSAATSLNKTNGYDYMILLNQIKNKYPKICFWISYNHYKKGGTTDWVYHSLVKQSNVSALFADSWVTTRDEINTNCVITNEDEVQVSEVLKVYPNPADGILYLSSPINNYYINQKK